MLIYIVYYAIILMSYFFCEEYEFNPRKNVSLKNSRRKIFICFAMGLLILIFGFRAQNMGIDLEGYLPSFEYLNTYSWVEIFKLDSYQNYEKGYIIFNKLIGSIWCNKQFFLFMCAMCIFIPLGIYIYKNSKNQLLSIIVYLGMPACLINFSGLRQAIALAITMLSFEFIKTRKPVKFILTVIFAGVFHSSAFIFLIAYPLYWIRLNKKMACVSIFVLPLIYVFRYPIFFVTSKLFKKSAIVDGNNAIRLFLVFMLLYVFCIVFGNRENEKTNGLSNIYWVACACQALAGVYSSCLRVGYYFIIPFCILLPEVLEEIDLKQFDKYKKVLYMMVFIGFMILGLFFIMDNSWAMAYPYNFFWEK